MQDLTNAILGQVNKANTGEHGCNGIVTAYDDGTYMCKVLVLPEEKETGWLPIPSIWTGAEWGLFCPPTVGDLVVIEFLNGDFESGYSIKRFFTDEEPPIKGIPSGEFWLVHATGTWLKLFNDGHMEINVAADLLTDVAGNHVENIKGSANITIDGAANVHIKSNATVTVDGNATINVAGTINSSAAQWNHTGPMSISGNVSTTGTLTNNAHDVGSTHKHKDVSTGTALSGVPQ